MVVIISNLNGIPTPGRPMGGLTLSFAVKALSGIIRLLDVSSFIRDINDTSAGT
jgi:hypothetical protein